MDSVKVTQEQIDAWKETHGEVHEIMVATKPTTFDPHMLQDDDVEQDEHISGFIKTPSEKVLGFAMQQIAKPTEAGAIILKNCWLGGDDRLKTDRGYLTSAAMQCLGVSPDSTVKAKKALEDFPEITDHENDSFAVMATWIRYFFPSIEPYDLAAEDFARIWREAQFLLVKTKPIQAEQK